MKPEYQSKRILGITRSSAKMLEYDIPEEYHIETHNEPDKLFSLTIGILGDFAATINSTDFDSEERTELKENLLFSANFFDAYFQAKLTDTLSPFLKLIGSATFYLCDLPGSAMAYPFSTTK